MTTIHDVLATFREAASSNRDLGDKFERLIAAYLVTDPLYADQFDSVWLWGEWPLRWGADTGIDLVARDRRTGEYCAIQCKFNDPARTLQKADIDSFFTASGKRFPTPDGVRTFTSRMIVSTTDNWSKHAEGALEDQVIPCIRLRVQDLADSPIDWGAFTLDRPAKLKLKTRKKVRPHQKAALKNVVAGLKRGDRGKLIMACGTGKTFTSLKLAEQLASPGGVILFLVPSISLLSQTLREWTAEAEIPIHAFAVCSDTKVGRHQEDMSAHDLALPATTNATRLTQALKGAPRKDRLTVVFSTYQSIDVVAQAQKAGAPDFDLVICDEAHRTTGVTLEGEDESHFVKIHNASYIRAKKRLYMTATPRLYADTAKSKAQENDAVLCSMDDEALYGPTFHRLGFGEAVSRGLLADYKVLVLAVDEKHVSKAIQKSLAAGENELKLEDAVKIVGCWNGLAKRFAADADATGLGDAASDDPAPMRRAVAFSRSIKDSKHLAAMFQTVVSEYVSRHEDDGSLRCEVEHVDGTFNVLKRNERLDWLRDASLDASSDNTCRILSNARCLSEGVDVPALDAVLFLNPRDSVVDVVQSVGRVMRRADEAGKKYGYVILPIGVPAGMAPEEALKDNQKYRVVWQVLQALRAHDDRFNATINQIELNKQRPDQIQVIGVGGQTGEGNGESGDQAKVTQIAFAFPDIELWRDAIYAKIVLKCGDRRYWEDWAKDVARIAERHTARVTALVESNKSARKAFERFLSGLHENINPSISTSEAVEMLSQHLITRPVFDALFENYSFSQHNSVSLAMQEVLDALESKSLDKEIEALQGFYESVRQRVKGIDNAAGRQRVIIELYDKFFKLAFPKMASRLGIVYTPVEVVDFIILSAEYALRKYFGVGLTDKNVHILDPFTGTGTFIARLLQSGLIRAKDLERKYREELHANEIVLLAYYIAAINIEETYHGLIADGAGASNYEAFEGIVLTDTFQLNEESRQTGFGEAMFPENNKRARRQKKRDIRVIMGNPPYSAQQESEGDNNRNLVYPVLDDRIRTTYAELSSSKLKKNNYDSYVRAIRWASDRIKDQGVIGFVTNGSFVDERNFDGVRKALASEFSRIYCFNLRGNQRTSGEVSRKEGGKVFGSGSRTSVAITLFIKNSIHARDCRLYYYDIGDYLSREEKLKIIRDFGSINSIPWQEITPNAEGDWVNQRHPEFDGFMAMGDKDSGSKEVLFDTYSLGVVTNRDPWVYNFSRPALEASVKRLIAAFNRESKRYTETIKGKPKDKWPAIDAFVNNDPKQISWTRSLKQSLSRGHQLKFDPACIVTSLYRPFCRQALYFDRRLNEMVNRVPALFPTPRHPNIVISITGVADRKGFSVLASRDVPNMHLTDTGQCFPLYWYERVEDKDDLFSGSQGADSEGYIRRDAVSDWALETFRKHYRDKGITKEAIFHYVYGILHSPEYREKYDASLKKTLPRIPFAKNFWAFSRAGGDLIALHVGYEDCEPWPLTEESADLALNPAEHYRVDKMTFARNGKAIDKSTIIYNSRVRLSGIPEDAYLYVVNGKSAIEWIMERYAVSEESASGIRNDPNAYSQDPRYIVDLLKRVVRVSVESMEIIRGLPPLGA